MSIFKLLNFDDIHISNLQNVNEMTVAPLIGTTRGEVASPEKIKFKSTVNYGEMEFYNEDSLDGIIPSHLQVRGPNAQDHAMAGSGILLANTETIFENACCIESSQGGFLRETEKNEFDILPVSLRKEFSNHLLFQEHKYDKLWKKIKDWLRGMELERHGAAHLRYFYDDPGVKDDLEAFAAEFEPVENQIGAIILFSGKLVGVEVMPNEAHWRHYWKMLIRGCYGAEFIRQKKLGMVDEIKQYFPKIRSQDDFDLMGEQMDNYIVQIQNYVNNEIMDIDHSKERVFHSEHMDNYQLNCETVSKIGYGDLILQRNNPVYLSLVF